MPATTAHGAFDTTATAASPVGSYSITASGAAGSNYTIVYVNGSLTVTPASLTITANNQSKVYGAALPALTASYSGFINGDTVSNLTTPANLATTATAGSPAGSYSITARSAASSNYTFVYVNGSLTVPPARLTISANNESMFKGSTVPALTATNASFVNGDTTASLSTPASLLTTATSASIGGLTPAKYRVKASSPGDMMGGRPEIRTDGTAEVHNASSYYPGVLIEKEAGLVQVHSGGESAGVDIKLVRVPFVRVSGKVSGLPQGAENLSVMIWQGDSGTGRPLKKDGTFELWRLDPGNDLVLNVVP